MEPSSKGWREVEGRVTRLLLAENASRRPCRCFSLHSSPLSIPDPVHRAALASAVVPALARFSNLTALTSPLGQPSPGNRMEGTPIPGRICHSAQRGIPVSQGSRKAHTLEVPIFMDRGPVVGPEWIGGAFGRWAVLLFCGNFVWNLRSHCLVVRPAGSRLPTLWPSFVCLVSTLPAFWCCIFLGFETALAGVTVPLPAWLDQLRSTALLSSSAGMRPVRHHAR